MSHRYSSTTRAYLKSEPRRFLFTAILAACPLNSFADTEKANAFFEDVNIHEKDGTYHISLTSRIEASAHHVHDVITDYTHIYRLSDSIVESKVGDSDDGTTLVETKVLCCIPVFCKEVTRTEEVHEFESGKIQTVILPEKSDFKSGGALWTIKSSGSSTLLTYEAHLEPDFYIPPIVGPKMIVDNMRDELSTTVYRIQHIARINEDKEWNDSLLFAPAGDNEEKPCRAQASNNIE